MKPGVINTVIRGRDDRDVFERARRSGFAGVEVDLPHDDLASDERLRGLLAASRSASLPIPSLVLGELNHGGLGADEPHVAEAAAQDIRRAIDWAGELGADIVLVPFFLRGELVTSEQIERAGRALKALCPLAAERGVSLCYEGTLPSSCVRQLAALVDSPGFGCYFDLANPVARGMDTATELRGLGDLIRRVHLKDTRVRGGDAHPGHGRVDFGESVRALAEIGYDGWLVFETPAGPEELVRRDLSFARSVFPSLETDLRWPRLGAFSYDFEAAEWNRLASTFAGLGLETVQVGGAMLDECLADPGRITGAMDALAEHGITVAGLGGYRNLVTPDAGRRRQNIEMLSRCLELAPRFGTSVVATETGTRNVTSDWSDSHDNWSLATWDVLVDALETLVPVAERSGAILALEAHVRNVLRTPGQLIGLLEHFRTPHLQVVCDPYNFVSAPALPAHERLTDDLLDRFEDRFVIAHLKDVAIVDGTVTTPEFGTGVFAQQPYLDFLRRRRPDLPLILEHLPLDHLAQAIRRVEAVIGPSRQ
jgi:L-ribulose-5-phosphate 3-epimerase